MNSEENTCFSANSVFWDISQRRAALESCGRMIFGDLGDFGAFFLLMRVWYIFKILQKALMPCVREPGRPCVERCFAG